MKKMFIIGASGQGKVAADIAKKIGYTHIMFLDDNEKITECGGYPVVGRASDYIEYDGDFIVAIGNPKNRKHFLDELESNGKSIISLVHPFASVGENVEIGKGTIVVAGSVINPGTKIGVGCIINTCSSVDHDCVIGNYSHVSVGAHVCGTVTIGENVWVGAGATVINNLSICSDAFIAAGAVVVKSITESGTYIGVPAKKKHEDSDSRK